MTRSSLSRVSESWPIPRVIDRAEVVRALTLPAAVEAVHVAYATLAQGVAQQPRPIGFDLADGQVHVKGAQLAPDAPVVVKIASGFPGNAARGRPTGDGALVVLDPHSGAVQALVLDGGWLTDVRTAAATAVSVRALGGPGTRRRLALLGTGVQADLTLRTLAATGLLPPEVCVWGRTPGAVERLLAPHRGGATSPIAARSAREAVTGADLVITTTPARVPVVEGEWLEAAALVVAVGADSVGKRECDAAVLARATLIVADSLAQSTSVGELQHVTPAALAGSVVELPSLLASAEAALPDGIRVCDLTGLGAADAAMAGLVLAARTQPHG